MRGQTLFDERAGASAGGAASGGADGLNAAQREAVEHAPGAGPLIVLSGPGTGKTRVITHRIAHLINQRGAAPESIVAVTFTVKAAAQLRERLASLVGPAAAERVHAHTIHGFGARVLARHGDRLDLPPLRPAGDERGRSGAGGRPRRCEMLDSAQERRMLRRLIIDEDLFGHARAGGLEGIIDEATKLFGRFDDHALAPEQVREFAERWRGMVLRGEGLDGSVLEGEALRAESERCGRFADVALLHGLFDRARREMGLLTYGDLLMLPIRLLREHAGVAAGLRARWRHWLVDEFQDVNAAQIEMLRLLAPPESGPDLCVVGDDDQSIYEFRGADDQAFRRFAAVWRGARVVKLSENYRSRPRVIDLCNSIIARAEDRFAPDKSIEYPAGKGRGEPGLIQCVHLRDEKEDGEAIAAMIRLDRPDKGEPAFERYAVVARTHGDLDRIEEALWLEGVPTTRGRAGSMAEDEGVRDLMAWCRLIAAPEEVWHARRLLLRPPIGLALEQVNAWDRRYRGAASRWRAARQGGDGSEDGNPGPFAAWLKQQAGRDPLAGKFVAWFEQFAHAATQESASELLVRITRETGVVHADLPGERERARRVESIVAVLNFAQSRQSRLPPPGGIREFLEYYDDLSESEQGFARAAPVDGDEDPDPGLAPGAVRLVTAHAAKGLEFDTVFVPRACPPNGYPNTRTRDETDWPEGLVRDVEGVPSRPAKERQLAEERRLFYVACTRAERRLVLLCKKLKGRSSSLHFVEEMLGDEAVRGLIDVVDVGDVLSAAAERAGGSGAGSGGGTDALRGLRSGDGVVTGVRDRRREVLERARREVRLAAAGALSCVDVPDADPARIDEATLVMRDAAERLAAIATVEATGKPPSWSARLGEAARRAIEDLARAVGLGVGNAPVAGAISGGLQRPRAPLDLSYTTVNDYLRCPRCYYARHILGMEGPPDRPTVLGAAMHRALQRFYDHFREADADGARGVSGGAPGLDVLTRLAREEFFGRGRRDLEVSREEFDRLMAQVRLGFEKLHEPDAHVLETERTIRFEYTCNDGSCPTPASGKKGRKKAEDGAPAAAREPVKHTMVATIDRIDQVPLPGGKTGFRIVDYKTGKPLKSLCEPGCDDLQLGIYWLALRHEYGDGIEGFAEYWVFSTGQRGRVALSDLDEGCIRRTIDGAANGIMDGLFARAAGCDGTLCGVLGE